MKKHLVLAILCSAVFTQVFPNVPSNARAPPLPTSVVVGLMAEFSGWNFSEVSGPNPPILSAMIFVGQTLQVNVNWADEVHNFAIYVPGTQSFQVDLFNLNSCRQTAGCLEETARPVSVSNPQESVTFTPSSFGAYEYFCEYHPDVMHGRIRVLKSPDLNLDGSVNIIDLAHVGAAFGAFPSSPNWNPNADLNFDSVINIIDLAIVAANFGRTL